MRPSTRTLAVAGVLTVALSVQVSVAAAAPVISTGAATAVTDSSASLAGSVDPQGQDTQYLFQYGITSAYGQQTPLGDADGGAGSVSESVTLSGLTAGTTYHYRFVAVRPGGGPEAFGTDETFTTGGAPPSSSPFKPVVSTASARALTVSGATVGGSINAEGVPTSYWIEFGPTSGYGYQTETASGGSGTSAQSVTAALTALPSNRTFHYRVVAQNVDGTSYGADASFTTDAPTPVVSQPAILGHTAFVSATSASVMAACVHGQTRCSSAVTITYHGVTIGGTRRSFAMAPNSGGVAHVTLNAYGRKVMLRNPRGLAVKVFMLNGGKTLTKKSVHLQPYDVHSGASRTRPQRPLSPTAQRSRSARS